MNAMSPRSSSGAGRQLTPNETHQMKCEIKTSRTEYQVRLYIVEADTVEEAEEFFNDWKAEEVSSNIVDAEEEVDEITPLDYSPPEPST